MLTGTAIAALKPKAKPYKRADRDGLFLLVSPAGPRNPTGSKLWRMKYQFAGKAQQLSFGAWPEVSLATAREKCRAAREQLRNKIDPAAAKRAPTIDAPTVGASFESVAREWHTRQVPGWDERHAWDVLNSLERDVFPTLGKMPLPAITPPVVLTVLRAVEVRGAVETAHRLRQRVSAVFVYAIACGLAEADPAAIVKGALSAVDKTRRQPAITDLDDLRTMMGRAEAEPCHPVTKLALRLLALSVVRPGELRNATWSEFELENGSSVWRLPAERMKAGIAHVVPLVPAAVEVLEVARVLHPRGAFVFPNARFAHKAMSENALGYLLNRAGYHQRHCPHGFRASFSSIMNELYPSDADANEVCLAHAVGGVRGRYLRSDFNGRRRELFEAWSRIVLKDLPSAAHLREGPRR
jgi:integrase